MRENLGAESNKGTYLVRAMTGVSPYHFSGTSQKENACIFRRVREDDRGARNPSEERSVAARSSPLRVAIMQAGVAQQAEQLTCNQQVGGSIPSTSSMAPAVIADAAKDNSQ